MVPKTAIVQVNEAGEYYIELDDETLNAAGFKIGDTLKWINNDDGSWSLTKMEDNLEYYVVDTISTFRCRFVVKAKSLNDALDEVAYREGDHEFAEFSQKHLGAQIVDGRRISKDDLMQLHAVDNDYLKNWSEEQIINGLTNTINYED